MNNHEITRLLTHRLSGRRLYRGVYPKDLLPAKIPETPSAYVINTDTSRGPGKHCVAVYFAVSGKAEYFDSFGLPPLDKEIKAFIKRNSQSVSHNSRLLQNITSSACGLYVVYFVLGKSKGLSLQRLTTPFQPHHLQKNDRRVRRLVQQQLRV